jgi:hypothetical protein
MRSIKYLLKLSILCIKEVPLAEGQITKLKIKQIIKSGNLC